MGLLEGLRFAVGVEARGKRIARGSRVGRGLEFWMIGLEDR
jgi:hypothetical protein